MITFENVSFGYGSQKPVLKELSFHINRGEMVALIGQNGAGKTTILKHMNGLLCPAKGRVKVGDLLTTSATVSQMAKKIAFLFQNPDHQIFLNTVASEIAYGPSNLGIKGSDLRDLVQKAAEQTGIQQLLEYTPQSLGKGLRQRVALASILAMEPEVLVLDEPTTGQDESEADEIMSIIKDKHQHGTTVVMVTHDMELVARYAQRVLVLANGTLIFTGTPEEVFSNSPILKQAGLCSPLSHQIRLLGLPISTECSYIQEEAVG